MPNTADLFTTLENRLRARMLNGASVNKGYDAYDIGKLNAFKEALVVLEEIEYEWSAMQEAAAEGRA